MKFPRKGPHRAVLAGVVMAGAVLTVKCTVIPQHDRVWEIGMFVGVALVWGGLVALLAGKPKFKTLLLVSPLLALLPFALPGKTINPGKLRADYVVRLRGYDGTRYIWGGESPLGIDCSGLPRRALRDALWSEGWRHSNGAAFRNWLAQWWYDSSAQAMGKAYRGQTRPLGLTGPLWEIEKSHLLPGDLAVRDGGGHVVVYLGDDQWIEADPIRGKVHCWQPRPGDGKWYGHFSAHRWVVCE